MGRASPEGLVKFHLLKRLHVWKNDAAAERVNERLHRRLGINRNSLMERVLFDRTALGAIRSEGARFGLFPSISAAFWTGFSASAPEN
jgi:hypothetical protein